MLLGGIWCVGLASLPCRVGQHQGVTWIAARESGDMGTDTGFVAQCAQAVDGADLDGDGHLDKYESIRNDRTFTIIVSE